jgi:hypothetical protein
MWLTRGKAGDVFEKANGKFHGLDGKRINEVAVDEAEIAAQALDFRNYFERVKAPVLTAVKNKVLKIVKIEQIGRHAHYECAGIICVFAHFAGVADGAIDIGTIQSQTPAL